MFGVLIRNRGMPVGCDSIEPTTNSIRRLFTAISTSPRTATAVEISFTICCAGVTIRRSSQLNYAPAWDTLIIVPSDTARFPLVSSRSLPFHLAVRDRAASARSTATRATAVWNSGIRLLALATERSTPKSALNRTHHVEFHEFKRDRVRSMLRSAQDAEFGDDVKVDKILPTY
jgi:hypothetical protein